VLEEQNGSPVVGEIFRETASRACRQASQVIVGVHGNVEGISTNDLVKMRGDDTWGYQGVKALNNELRAGKA
jgi:hypothetical protein